MAKAEDKRDLNEVIHESDTFRQVIRGHALLEDLIAETLADACGGDLPPELKRLPYRSRLALLLALTPLSENFAQPLHQLAQLRHDLAHGKIDDVSEERAKALATSFDGVVKRDDLFVSDEPRVLLAACFMVAHSAIQAAREIADELRFGGQMAFLERHQARLAEDQPPS